MGGFLNAGRTKRVSRLESAGIFRLKAESDTL